MIGNNMDFGLPTLKIPEFSNPFTVGQPPAKDNVHHSPSGTFLASKAPWGLLGQTPVESPFFPYITLDPTLWDKLLPYRLLVVDTSKNNKPVVNGGNPSPIDIFPLGNGTLAFTQVSKAWEFRLPITPQQLNITDNYAINTSATLRGVLEEHSGVRFKNIAIQGTFGVWPGRASVLKSPEPAGPLQSAIQSVFGGAIAAAGNVVTQFQSVVNSALTGTGASKPVTIVPGSNDGGEFGEGTGYYQTMMLTQFLEQYAEAKKDPANAGWRLVFDIPKQSQSFVVTPVGFTWNENVNKPMEISFNLQLKAWRRINLVEKFLDQPLPIVKVTPGILQRILNTISAARNTAAASYNLIGSVRSDVDNVLNVIRQTGLFVKDLAGVAIAASDLPSQLVNDSKSTITQFMSTLSLNNLTGSAATNGGVMAGIAALKSSVKKQEGLSRDAVAGGQLGPAAASAQAVDPSNNVFLKPQTNPQLFDQVPVSSLKLNSAQQKALDNEINRVRSFTVSDLKAMRGTIQDLVTQLASSFGAGNAFFSKTYNKPAPTKRNEPMTLDEYDILQSFYELLQSYDILTATNQLDKNQIPNDMEYVQGLAQDSNIQFSIPNSKVQVPVPFGLNMEGIALRYLGDAQRWLEIATLNFLQEPYIDETGFQYVLTSNGDGRSVVVGSNANLYVGQKISISSNVQNTISRTILEITTLSQTSFLLTLDGAANLDIYKLADGASIKGYLAGTTNSQKVIWIPSDLATPVDDGISIPTSVANVDLVGVSKVDWLLDENFDLAVTSAGDFRLAAGIPNLIQALRLKFGTALNSSYLHPDFGLPVKIGGSSADSTASKIYSDINKMITADTRFSGLSGLQVSLNGPSLNISAGVQVSGTKGIFPVSFQLGNQ